MNLSHWEYEAFFKDIEVLVIGSGIVGLHAALRIKELDRALRVLVLDKGPLPAGASTRNAGFACFGSLGELISDMDSLGEDAVLDLIEKRWIGLQRLQMRLGRSSLSYQTIGGYELFRAQDQELYERCCDSMSEMNRYLNTIIGNEEVFKRADHLIDQFGFGHTKNLISNAEEGQLHSGRMVKHLKHYAESKRARIINGLGVQKFEDVGDRVWITCENGWEFWVRKVIVATNGFARQLLPDLDVTAVRNQVWLTKTIPIVPFKGCFHYDRGYVYFRNLGNQVLIGGARNVDPEGETTYEFGKSQVIQEALDGFMREVVLPNTSWEIGHKWSGILGVGSQKVPIMKKVSENIIAAVRMGGMGVGIGGWIGEQAAEMAVKGS